FFGPATDGYPYVNPYQAARPMQASDIVALGQPAYDPYAASRAGLAYPVNDVRAVRAVQTSAPVRRTAATRVEGSSGRNWTKTAAAGSRISLYVDVTPNPGIHVYAPGAKGYLPIGLKMDATRDVTAGALSYPRSQTLIFEGQKIPVYDKPFRLAQQVTLNRS